MRLPKSVQKIADVIGRDQALHLVRELPPCGRRSRRRNIYIPTPANLSDDHKLVALVGKEDAEALAEALGGQSIQPALCRYMERAMANRRILALRDLGRSVAEIAVELKMSEKWVSMVVEAREMHQAGIDIEIIAHSVKISPLTIGYILGVDIGEGLDDAPVKRRGERRPPDPQLGLDL
ncbi:MULTISPECIES: hypothetical protein [unclassified Halomonas]|uniref:hypothetical protein n=1 Tax=unclassified Halomonas TaxID=2609666 RepID=UPI002883F671|nr:MULTISPECIES: hypothetical protein [unclassified Halomonas]MDT0499693.1 hypothetical protein [Halomonas sp. PAR7]MDT0510490.1 hypothetical protein [Halomonas sp. LES1]MDT0589801.1 hypothetical protein [Halomonas sp. PAR8]